MSKDVSPARGFRDYAPADKARRDRLLSTIRGVYAEHGFAEIETPVVEPLDRLRSSDGGDNVGMIFAIQRRGLSVEDAHAVGAVHELCDLGLRYDLTVPLSRFYASEHARLPRVARLIQIAPVWRAERPQKGRFRQFTQCDIDIIGEPGPLAETELVTTTLTALDALGVRGATVRINDRRLLKALLESAGVADERRAAVLVVIDKRDKIGLEQVQQQLDELDLGDGVAATLGRHLQRFASGPIDADEFATLLDASDEATVALDDHRTIVAGVEALVGPGVVRFDPTLVRGLGYYTGTIFEVEHPESGSSIGGGGRYDGMVGRFLGRDVPACGFSLGFERLVDLAPDPEASGPQRIALVYTDDAPATEILTEKRAWIARGHAVTLVPRAKNMRRVLDEVRALGIAAYATLGSDELRDLQ
ncbi:MAG: histidine--tRNA ligase [Patulibacter sp.]